MSTTNVTPNQGSDFNPSDMPMISPEGTPMRIPRANSQAAQAKGFQPATYMTSPEGRQMVVPIANAGKALQQGFKSGRPAVQKAPALRVIGWRSIEPAGLNFRDGNGCFPSR